MAGTISLGRHNDLVGQKVAAKNVLVDVGCSNGRKKTFSKSDDDAVQCWIVIGDIVDGCEGIVGEIETKKYGNQRWYNRFGVYYRCYALPIL